MTGSRRRSIAPRRLSVIVTHPITAELLMRGQLRFLRRAGWDVELISSPGERLERAGREEAVQTTAIEMAREIRPWKDLRSLLALRRRLRESRPTVVNAGTPKAGLLGMIAAAWARIPIRVYTQRGLRLETTRGAKRLLLAAGERLAARLAHRVVCVSESLRQRSIELRLVRAEKAVVLGSGSSNGVDVERFKPLGAGDDRAANRRALGLSTDSFVIGFVGRLTRDKGLPDLMSAFDAILEERPDATLLLLGELEGGDPVPSSTAERIRRDSRVLNPGFVDPAPYYRVIDVLAFPSLREGFPNAPLEAAACGVPTVAYAVTGSVDAVQHETTGLLVPPGRADRLAEALARYAADPELAARHGAAARDRAVRRFRSDRVWQEWDNLYHVLVAERSGEERPLA